VSWIDSRQRHEIHFFSKNFTPALQPTHYTSQWESELLSFGLKLPEHEALPWQVHVAIALPSIWIGACCLNKYWDGVTIYFQLKWDATSCDVWTALLVYNKRVFCGDVCQVLQSITERGKKETKYLYFYVPDNKRRYCTECVPAFPHINRLFISPCLVLF